MQNIFTILTILFLISTLTLIGVSFYFSQDSLIKFAPPNADFYLHFNLNPLHPSGLRAMEYFRQHWPQKLIAKTIGNALEYNFKPEILDQLDEIAVLYLNKEPVAILKYKPAFGNPCLVSGKHIFYRFLNIQTVAFSTSQSSLNQLDLRPTLGIESAFKNFTHSGFLNTPLGKIYLSIKDDQIVFSGNSNKQSSSEFLAKQIDYLINPNDYPKNFYIIALSKQKYSVSSLIQMLDKKLSYLYPSEIIQKLPDDTAITELVSQPKKFQLKKQKIGQLEVISFAPIENAPAVYFISDQNYIFLSTSDKFLAKNLFQIKNAEPQCLFKGADEILYWSSYNDGIQRLILSSRSLKDAASIEGCLNWR